MLAPIIGKPKTPFSRAHIPRLILVAFSSVAGYHLSLNYAETIVSSGLAGLLISVSPIFVVLLSAIFLKERTGVRLVMAIAIAIIGATILSITSSLTFLDIKGPFAVVLAAFMYGALPIAVWSAVFGTVLIMPMVSGSFFAEVRTLSLVAWLSVLYLSILRTVIANIILYTLIGTRSVSVLSVQLHLVPTVSLVGGVLLLGESMTLLTIVGGAFLLAAATLVTMKKP